MKFIKVAKSNTLDKGNFTNNRGTWKKVLDKSIETEILGAVAKIDLFHFETNTEDSDLKESFNSSTQYFKITNINELKELLEDRINQELADEIGEFEYGGGTYLIITTEGKLTK